LDVVIQNIVATGTRGHKIDLISILKAFLGAEYNPKKFSGLVFRIERPKPRPSYSARGR